MHIGETVNMVIPNDRASRKVGMLVEIWHNDRNTGA
jgi:hypothetical protein